MKINLFRSTLIALALILSVQVLADYPRKWKYVNVGSGNQVHSMLADSIGNIYVSGDFSSQEFKYKDISVFGASGDVNNLFLLKTNPNGKPVWLHSVSGFGNGWNIEVKKMVINQNGELAVIIQSNAADKIKLGKRIIDLPHNGKNTIVCKISKTGFITWVRQIKTVLEPGGARGTDIAINDTGVVFITGYFKDEKIEIGAQQAPGSYAGNMYFLSKIGARGEIEWIKTSETKGEIGDIYPLKILLNENSLFIAGEINGDLSFIFGRDTLHAMNQKKDVFFAKFDLLGEPLWARQFYGDTTDYLDDIKLDKSGNILVQVLFKSINIQLPSGQNYDRTGTDMDLLLGLYNSEGIETAALPLNIQLKDDFNYRKYLSEPVAKGKILTSFDRNNILTIVTEFRSASIAGIINTEENTSDIMIAKFNPSDLNKPLWIRQAEGVGETKYGSGYIDLNGNVILEGNTQNQIKVNGEITAPNDVSAYGVEYCVMIDKSGNIDYSYTKQNETNATMNFDAVASDIFGNVYVVGNFYGSTPNSIGSHDVSGNGIMITKYAKVDTLGGSVKNEEGSPVTSANIIIFGYAIFQKAPITDTIPVQADGSFKLPDIPWGRYLLKAVPNGTSETMYSETYYPNISHWSDADKITVGPLSSNSGYDIVIKTLSELKGTSEISGTVLEIDSTDFFKSAGEVFGRPSSKATVILVGNTKTKSTEEYEIIQVTETDENGNFAFIGIEDGDYILQVDIPGLPSEYYDVTIVDGQFISALDFLVEEDKVVIKGDPVYSHVKKNVLSSEGVIWYPNPAKEKLHISFESSPYKRAAIEIYSLNGEKLMNTTIGIGSSEININNLVSGAYILKIQTESLLINEKLLVR